MAASRKWKDALLFPFSHIKFSTACGKHRGKLKNVVAACFFTLLKNLLLFNNNLIFFVFWKTKRKILTPKIRLYLRFSKDRFQSPKFFTIFTFPHRIFSRISTTKHPLKSFTQNPKSFPYSFPSEKQRSFDLKTQANPCFFALFQTFHAT